MFPFPVDPKEFVVWLLTDAAAGVIIALLFERAKWFQALSSQGKHRLVLFTFLALPFLSVLGQWAFGLPVVLPSGPQAIALWAFGLLFRGLTAWGASQYGHGVDPEKHRLRFMALLIPGKVKIE